MLKVDLHRIVEPLQHGLCFSSMRSLFITMLACASLAIGCASSKDRAAQQMQRTELYFGQDTNVGSEVSADEWNAFVDQEITPRFPAGVTILDADGQWTSPQGVLVREDSRLIILLHSTSHEEESKIEAIRSQYVKQFSQDAVMRVDSVALVRF